MSHLNVDVKELQRSLNTFTNRWLSGVRPLIVDGNKGYATNRRILTVKYYLGYGNDRDSHVTRPFIRRMRHPRDSQYFPPGMITTGMRRRAAQRARYLANQAQALWTSGVTYYDGKPVAKCAVPYLNYARRNGWKGGLNSGWRSPSYSQSLCYAMCGAPSCAGKCAGTASNHVGSTCDRFAVDVSDYYTFGRLMKQMPIPAGKHRIYNALGVRDPVHFSPSGN
jgi:hypothetical protein